jgi:serine/threonine protein kinase
VQEVQLLGACRHENLLPLLGFSADRGTGQEGEGVCLVTPLMKGGSLEDRLFLDASARRRLAMIPGAPDNGFNPLSWQQLLAVAADALKGLEYLHTPDPATHKPAILHRDIKPSNLLLDLDLGARLADMGLARQAAQHITTMTTLAGTNGFMDNFYMSTGRFDASCDGYAMGVTLLVLLTRWPAVDEAHGDIFGRCFDSEEEIVALAHAEADWPRDVAAEVYKVCMGLVHPTRARRITVTVARQRIAALAEAHPAPADHMAERECVMCLSAPRHARFACGHSQLCLGCVRIYLQRPSPTCTLCRAPVSEAGLVESEDVARQDTFVRPRGLSLLSHRLGGNLQ